VSTIKVVISGPRGVGSALAQRLVALLTVEGLPGEDTDEVIVFTTNFEVDETQDGLGLEEEGRVCK